MGKQLIEFRRAVLGAQGQVEALRYIWGVVVASRETLLSVTPLSFRPLWVFPPGLLPGARTRQGPADSSYLVPETP